MNGMTKRLAGVSGSRAQVRQACASYIMAVAALKEKISIALATGHSPYPSEQLLLSAG